MNCIQRLPNGSTLEQISIIDDGYAIVRDTSDNRYWLIDRKNPFRMALLSYTRGYKGKMGKELKRAYLKLKIPRDFCHDNLEQQTCSGDCECCEYLRNGTMNKLAEEAIKAIC